MELRTRLSRELDREVVELRRVSGGDMAEAFRVEFDDGSIAFAKTHVAPPEGFFSREADDLAWLAETAAMPVPEVLAVSDEGPAFLALSWVEAGPRSYADEATFGRSLAQLHLVGAPCFGRSDGRTTGSQALPNDPCSTWAEFYAERRLLPLARIASDRRALPGSTVAALETLATRLDEFASAEEPPARLHGDLWAGNRMVDASGASWLIDPASHGGHREFDLAMMRLFGGFGEEAFAAYDEESPLAQGWQERVSLHQLAPLVVHAIKFGGGYVGAAAEALDRYR